MSTTPADPYFTVLDERADRGRYLAAAGTAGPWTAGLQHGGPPSALLVRASERAAAQASEVDLVAMRVAVEFLGPVPMGEVTLVTRVVRAARTAVLVDAELSAGDRVCLHGRVWLVRRADTSALAPPVSAAVTVPRDLPDVGGDFPYHDTIDWQSITASMRTPGPGLVWARPKVALVPGEQLSGLQRVALIGDSASGISSELDWDVWSFVNIDLDVHLARPVEGEWVLIDAATTVGTAGAALARSTVSDVYGPVGATSQTLVIAAR
ncbi:MAG: thioesterase family protein [Jatrophihabitantaceae bacterium]